MGDRMVQCTGKDLDEMKRALTIAMIATMLAANAAYAQRRGRDYPQHPPHRCHFVVRKAWRCDTGFCGWHEVLVYVCGRK